MSRISSVQQEVSKCPLQELVAEVRLMQDKFGRVIEEQKDIAETLSRAAARLRTMAVARDWRSAAKPKSPGQPIPYRADRLVLIAPPDYAIAERANTPFLAVLNYPFVMLHSGSAIHTFTMNAAAFGRHLEVRIQLRSFEAICGMVSADGGLATGATQRRTGRKVTSSPCRGRTR